MAGYRVLPGLPPYGPPAISFPEEWGRSGREGFVVEFVLKPSITWVGNFAPGIGGLQEVRPHPDGRQLIAISAGDAWVVDPEARRAERLAYSIEAAWDMRDPQGFVFSLQGLAFLRIGPAGLIWRTRRISWDGFRNVQVRDNRLTGFAWLPHDDTWHPFSVDSQTGTTSGGTFSDLDFEGWERLGGAASAS